MWRRTVVRGGLRQCLTSSWQKHGDGRTLPETRVDTNLSAGLLRKPEDLAESEPRTFSDLFRREEWLKGFRSDLAGHACSSVTHRDRDVVCHRQADGPTAIGGSYVLCRDGQPPSVRHGITAVDSKI